MANLLNAHTWIGTFYPPDQIEQSFGGKLTYTPEKGPRLECVIPINDLASEQHQFLYGILNDGHACTLGGDFSVAESSFKMKNNYCSFYKKEHRFNYLLLGAQFKPEQTYDSFRFSISGIENFFTSSLDRTPYQSTPVVTAKFDIGEIEVSLRASGEALPRNIKEKIFSTDQESLNKLQNAYSEIVQDAPDFIPIIKKQIEYQITLKPKKEKTIHEAYAIARKINNLFSLLFFAPTQLKHFEAIARLDKNHPIYLPVFVPSFSTGSTTQKSQSIRNHYDLPIVSKDIDLGKTITRWMCTSENHDTITPPYSPSIKIQPFFAD